MNGPWTPARVAKLEKGIADSLSARAIAQSLGMTRNAIIGKASRLGLSFTGTDVQASGQRIKHIASFHRRKDPICIAPPSKAKPSRAPKGEADPFAKPKALPRLRIVQTDARMLVLADLESGMCKYPMDDPGPGRMHLTLFCGADSGEETYCPAHQEICFNKPKSVGAEYTRSLRRWTA